jgi:hypothetical protein
MILNFGQASNPVVLALPSKNGANPKIPSLHHVLVVATYPKKANVVLSLPSTLHQNIDISSYSTHHKRIL